MSHGFTKEQPLDTDVNLAGNSDYIAPSQKAIKTYVDARDLSSADLAETSAWANGGTGTHAAMDSHMSSTSNPHSVTAAQAAAIPNDGWIAISATGTSGTLDAPSFEISFNADMTSIIGLGDRIKITQSTTKYFIVTKVGAYGSGATIITCYGGTDYTLVATATTAITAPFVSHVKSPFGMPMAKEKWTVTVTDTTTRTQLTPTANQYYNLNTTSIGVPIGQWELSISCVSGTSKAASNVDLNVALSTSNNSVSSELLHRYTGGYAFMYLTYYMSTVVTLTAKATYYLIIATGVSGSTRIEVYNAGGNMELRAVCTYL